MHEEEENDSMHESPRSSKESETEEQSPSLSLESSKSKVPKASLPQSFRSVEYLKQNVPGICEHLEIIRKIGEGTFATVFLAESRTDPPLPFALKALVPTVHTSRIENELKLLALVGGRQNVVRLLSAWRYKDLVFLLMPYIEHERFTDYFLSMDALAVRTYMRNLMVALRHLHYYGVVHRDVKPSNFLYNRRRNLYVLVDFGLAHTEKNRSRKSTDVKKPRGEVTVGHLLRPSLGSSAGPTHSLGSAQCRCGDRPVTCRVCSALPPMGQGAARGGTCGYRAPEVVMRCPDQTVAIDVWSAGMIFASFIAGRCPPLYSNSDNDYLHKVVFLCGYERMQAAAWCVNRRLVVHPAPAPDSSLSYADRLQLRLARMRERMGRGEAAEGAVPASGPALAPSAFRLLARMLDPNPLTRISAREALRHPFLAEAGAQARKRPSADLPGPSPEAKKPIIDLPGPIREERNPIIKEKKPITDLPGPIMEVNNPLIEEKKPIEDLPNPIREEKNPISEAKNPIMNLSDPIKNLPDSVSEVKNPITKAKTPITEEKKPIINLPDPIREEKNPITEAKKPIMNLSDPIKNLSDSISEVKNPITKAKNPITEEKKPIIDLPDPIREEKNPISEAKKPTMNLSDPITKAKNPITEEKSPIKELSSRTPDRKRSTKDLSVEKKATRDSPIRISDGKKATRDSPIRISGVKKATRDSPVPMPEARNRRSSERVDPRNSKMK